MVIDGLVPADSVSNTTRSDGHADKAQQPERTPQSVSPPWSTTTTKEGPFCQFSPAKNHQTTQNPAIPSQTRSKLIKTREATLPTHLRSPQWTLPNEYRGCFRQGSGNLTPDTQQLVTATNNQRPDQHANLPGTLPVATIITTKSATRN